jgi:lipoyl(octanoyl) transferase
MNGFDVLDLGRMGYAQALLEQESRFNAMLDAKRQGQKGLRGTLLLVEHDPVYTLGKSGKLEHLKKTPQEVGAEFYKTSRGGDITYHGPGQIVGYPIFDLEYFQMGIADYIHAVEESIIQVIAAHGLKGDRIGDASGVWLDPTSPNARKICAIGVKASRYVTMHGFAFNVNTDLSYFEHIIPCGIDDKGVTSLAHETGQSCDIDQVKSAVCIAFDKIFKPLT